MLREAGFLIKSLNTPKKKVYRIVNKTRCPIGVNSTSGNSYSLYPYLSEVVTESDSCDAIVHGCKQTFCLSKETGVESFPITQKLRLLKTSQS